MTPREHEHTLNVWLAEALKSRGLNAVAERPSQSRRIDVKVTLQRARGGAEVIVAVEAEQGQNPAKMAEAIKDAEARLPGQQNLARCAIALCYPDLTTPESLPTAKLMWTVRDGRQDGGPASWQTGSVDALAAAIRLAPAQLGDPDGAAATLSSSLDSAAAYLSESQKRLLAQALDLPRQTRNGKLVRNPWDAPAKRALLVAATAVMFHSRLDSHLNGMPPDVDVRHSPPQPFAGSWPPLMAQLCLESSDPIGRFSDAWNLILALDYKPIFETGRAALLAVPPDPSFSDAVRIAAEAALAAARDTASYRHDLLGRIFHTVLDTARYDGSFYTTTPAATLLAALAITDDLCDWTDPDAIAKLRITDPACGTGTLLMAAAERIRELAPQAEVDADTARALIEQVFTGYDVNLTATHMAATTLGLLSPTTQFRNMKIGRVLLGVDDGGKTHLGSLEFLGDQQPHIMPWPNAAQLVSQVDTGDEIAVTEPADLVIMNPPFTRDSLRHDQFSREDERKIKAREKDLFAAYPNYMAGNSGAFLVLANYISKPDTGTIAAILPLTGATDKSGHGIRKYLGRHYHVELIVTSHDPERIYFSENTNIGEMLLICRRWPGKEKDKPPTRVVNLARNPATPAESLTVARAIENSTVSAQNYGTVQEWPASQIAVGDWSAVQFLSPYLCRRSTELIHGDLFPSVRLEAIAEIGPEGRRTRDAFTRSNMPDAEGRVALWQHETDVIQTMAAQPDTHLVAKPSKAHLAERYWQQRSRMLLPTRLFLPSTRLASVLMDTPGLGSAWVPCRVKPTKNQPEQLEMALCAYLNSSVGILAVMGERSNRKPTYPRFSLDDLRNLPVPDFAALGVAAAAQLAAAYDAHASDILLPLPQMDADPVRRALDAAVVAALGLDDELATTIRRQLAAEPSVTGRRYGQ